MNALIGNDRLSAAENALADDVPFGGYRHISSSLFSRYLELLVLIAKKVPSAQLLLNILNTADGELRNAILSDPLVRRTIEDGVCLHELGHDAIDHQKLNQLLSVAAECAVGAHTSVVAKAGGCLPISTAPRHSYIWSDPTIDDITTQHFKTQCLSRLPGFRIEQPKTEEVENIVAAAEMLDRLLPKLGRSALSHTSMVVVASFTGIKSLTVLGLPGTVFLSPTVVTTPALAAEALLHESMHLKYMDIEYSEPLFSLGFRPQLSPKVTPPWTRGTRSGEWPLDRLLTAMHVYTALALFWGRVARLATESVDAHSPEYTPDAEMLCNRSLQRTRYLIDKAREYPDVFTKTGQAFIEWISQVHMKLCPSAFTA